MRPAKQAIFGAPETKTPRIDILFAQAQAAHASGNLAEAQAGYKKVLKKRSDHFGAWHMLGVCELLSADYEAAVRALKRALLLDSRSAAVHSDLGITLKAQQKYADALPCFDKAIALRPNFANAHCNRGNLLIELKRCDEAIAEFDRAIAIDPQHPQAWKSRGNALHGLARFADAVASYDQALAIAPGDAVAWTSRGEMFRCLERFDEALASFDRALSIDPNLPQAWLLRASTLMMQGKVADAEAHCLRALAIKPDYSNALVLLGQFHLHRADADAAVACFERSLAISPDDESALSNKIFALDFSGNGDFTAHQAARTDWWRRIGAKIAAERPAQYQNDRDPSRRIVLGYVSAELKDRSSVFAVRPVLANHDKSQFEVVCYSCNPREDAVTDSFRQIADRWRNASQWSDDRLADCIRADKVDILIDLSGHTEGNRLRVFARKPAPIQVTAWGHVTGTGLPTIDYLFSDPILLPAEVRHLVTEQACDLPCAIIVEPPRAELRAKEAPVLSNGYVTYGVFSRVSRFSDAAIDIWARILRSDATARLLMKDHLLGDASIQSRLLNNFAARGIAPDRISFMGSTSREEHLAAYARIDVCLDPIPHGGGVSTWEALHMGVPVVTRLGNGMATRLGGGILSGIGMPDWIAADDDQYVEIALRSSPDRLSAIRQELPDLIARRCGPAAYTRYVEAAYRTMWRKYCNGLPG